MDKVNRRRFFGMFGAGAAVAAPAAVAATTRFKADLQDATTREVFNESTKAYLMGGGTIPAEDALRVAFLRESEVLWLADTGPPEEALPAWRRSRPGSTCSSSSTGSASARCGGRENAGRG